MPRGAGLLPISSLCFRRECMQLHLSIGLSVLFTPTRWQNI